MRILLFLCSLFLVAACRPADEASRAARVVTDDLSRTMQLPDTVRRVLTLAPSLTELVVAAGASHRLVAASDADDYPPAVDTLSRFAVLPLDYEAVVALRPDLVLATSQVNSAEVAPPLVDAGIPVYFFAYGSLDGMLESLRTTGELLGTAQAADEAARRLEARLALLADQTAALDHRPSTLVLVGDETLFAFGAGSYVHDLVARAGGRSVTAELPTAAPVLDDEYVLTTRPEVIVGTFGTDYDIDRLLALHPTWTVVPAVRDGRVYSIDPDLVLRPGPRLVDGAWRLAELLHPLRVDDALPPP